jgi:hypothetical protein
MLTLSRSQANRAVASRRGRRGRRAAPRAQAQTSEHQNMLTSAQSSKSDGKTLSGVGTNADSISALVQTVTKAMTTDSIEDMVNCFAEDSEWIIMATGESFKGHDQIRRLAERSVAARKHEGGLGIKPFNVFTNPERRLSRPVLTGFAGLIAGACSMALGEWVSVQSSRLRRNFRSVGLAIPHRRATSILR